ncbi:MAG: hypothetical protein V1899_05555 [Planctomycetota bacterium]
MIPYLRGGAAVFQRHAPNTPEVFKKLVTVQSLSFIQRFIAIQIV